MANPLASHIYHVTRLLFSACPLSKKLRNKSQLIFAHSPFSALALSDSRPPPAITETKTFSHVYQECTHHTALHPGKQAHARMIVSGFAPTIFVSNCLIQMYVECSSWGYARKVFDRMTQRDVVSYNAMVSGHSGCGEMGMARRLFDEMRERDVVSWNSLISGYLQNGECWRSFDVFLEMGRSAVRFDRTSFAVVLKCCASLGEWSLGVQVHGVVVRMGCDEDIFAGSALVDMYAKCGRLDDSLRVFSEMPQKNWVSWSAMIAGCVQNNWYVEGLELFKEMQKVGVGVSQSIFASAFRSCAGLSALELGAQLHSHALKGNFGSDVIVGTATLDMYAKSGNMVDAHKLFNSLPKHNLQSFNAIIVGYTRSDQGFKALNLFHLLLKSGLGFDEVSLSGAFCACASIRGHLEGLQVHGLAVKSPFGSNICAANAILDMYGKCGSLFEACCVFDEMEVRDAVSWNTIIAAHEQNRDEEKTLFLFVSMLHSRMEPDEFTYGSVLKACAGRQAFKNGMEIHNRIIKSGMGLNSFVGGALVGMYCKCEMVKEAEKIHERTEKQTMVSWNAIISGFSMLRKSEDAQNFFSRLLERGVKPDSFTYAAVLDTCANLATVELGKQIHAQIIKLELQSDAYISSTLVDMYSKCGQVKDCQLMFEKAPERDFVTWNAMICGYSQHGLGEEALRTFENMQLENVKPNHATFVSVLRACAHMGLVDKGLNYFNAMRHRYGLDPQLEHYSCMVDILGRSGQIVEALKVIQEMPFEADEVIWKTLLSICKLHGNVEVAEIAASSILQLDPQDSSCYILLSNIYADAGLWGKASEMRKIMRYNKLKKEPGCSWIGVKDEVHTFLVADKAHPRWKEIYEELGLLITEMKLVEYAPDNIGAILDEEVEDDEQLEELRICI